MENLFRLRSHNTHGSEVVLGLEVLDGLSYGLAWTLVLSYPIRALISWIATISGRVTGFGIAGNLRRHYPASLSGSIVLLLLIANLIKAGGKFARIRIDAYIG